MNRHYIFVFYCSSLICFFLAACQSIIKQTQLTPVRSSLETQTATRTPGITLTGLSTFEAKDSTVLQPSFSEKVKYLHPDGFYEMMIPKVFKITKNEQFISLEEEISRIEINMFTFDTIYAYNESSTTNLINAREANVFPSEVGYFEIEKWFDISTGFLHVNKLISTDLQANIIQSSYFSLDKAVFVFDFWSPKDQFIQNINIMDTMLKTISFDQDKINNFEEGFSTPDFQYRDENFNINVPIFWQIINSKSTHSMVNTFLSPDQYVIIQIITYTDEDPLPKSIVGEFVLSLLGDLYAQDLIITQNKLCASGWEGIVWNSGNNQSTGITHFSIRDNMLLVMTLIYQPSYMQYYRQIIENTLQTYDAHSSGDYVACEVLP